MNDRGERPTYSGDWFPAEVHIRNAETGETRVYATWESYPDAEGLGSLEFSWGEHNNACDCNRADFFARAAGENDPRDAPCGDGRYVVDRIVDARNGRVVYRDDAASGPPS